VHSKKRLSQFQKYPTGITSLGFSPDGTMLAVGVSYLFEDPEPVNSPEPSVFVRGITDAEAKPK
jgi:cell cycle arrest protein BUB3